VAGWQIQAGLSGWAGLQNQECLSGFLQEQAGLSEYMTAWHNQTGYVDVVHRIRQIYQNGAGWQNQEGFTGWGRLAGTNGSIRMGHVGRIRQAFQDGAFGRNERVYQVGAGWQNQEGFSRSGSLAGRNGFLRMGQVGRIR
jgi:hypothetical protein